MHLLYATPVLLSGVATLVLSKPELRLLATHYKCTVQKLQRLHRNTPRSVVFLLGGCLPLEAILHSRQLGLFSMICHLPGDPLHSHAKHILSFAPRKAKSWFQLVQDICTLYGLPCPLQMLDSPVPKGAFKKLVKIKVLNYWHELLRSEASCMKSLRYFKPELCSLTRTHYIWSSSASNPFECSKSTVLARMVSGRYRSESLCKHWSDNKMGYCRAPTCLQTPGTLEHLLASCPALESTRERLYDMWLQRSVMFPSLHSIIRGVIDSDESTITQFILEPLAFPQIALDSNNHGKRFIEQLSYLTRTFAFYIDRDYKKIVQTSPTQHQSVLSLDTNSLSVAVTRPDHPSVLGTSTTPPPHLSLQPREQSDHRPGPTEVHQDHLITVPDYQAQHPTNSTSSLLSPAQLPSPQCRHHCIVQSVKSLPLPSMPWLLFPGCVNPAATAWASTDNSKDKLS